MQVSERVNQIRNLHNEKHLFHGNTCKTYVNDMLNEYDALQSKLTAAEKQIAEKDDAIEYLKKLRRADTNNMTLMHKQMDEKDAEIAKLNDWNDHLQKVCQDRDAQNLGLTTTVKQLQTANTQLEQKVKEQDDKLKAMAVESYGLNLKIKELETANAVLAAKLEKAIQRMNSYRLLHHTHMKISPEVTATMLQDDLNELDSMTPESIKKGKV